MSAPLVADRGSYMRTYLVADIEYSPRYRYRGSYISAPLVADIEDLT